MIGHEAMQRRGLLSGWPAARNGWREENERFGMSGGVVMGRRQETAKRFPR